jgi:hypothetical protein
VSKKRKLSSESSDDEKNEKSSTFSNAGYKNKIEDFPTVDVNPSETDVPPKKKHKKHKKHKKDKKKKERKEASSKIESEEAENLEEKKRVSSPK